MHFTTALIALLSAPLILAAPSADALPDRHFRPEQTKDERIKLKITSQSIGTWKPDIKINAWRSVAKDLKKPSGPFFEQVCFDNPTKAGRGHYVCVFDNGAGGRVTGNDGKEIILNALHGCQKVQKAVYAVKCCKDFCVR
ncbi:hypothetical protein W97_06542 [Coniosporium apollinis CBS 100218]|uniref:AA1-like domain-containing protein n=1 Tax=Coniosporium apollinis (strain CBS 100218) TaxID=1168221 RepID=R7YZR9_CONA1|nr:uncharacterized protein W97_06542 [Coniosporium apollinis CBS 100218]EON67289.1 hypothetical protein W97_06542 [Coniosporium apollinis CBS 100218]